MEYGSRMKARLLVLVPLLLALTGCSGSSTSQSPVAPSDGAATPACEAAAVGALAAEAELQATHPVWVNDRPDAEVGSPEAEEWAALTADEEAQWLAIMRPVYETCEGPDDWWAVVQRHPGLAGMTGPEFVTPDMLEGWCYDDPDLSACSGYAEWLEANMK